MRKTITSKSEKETRKIATQLAAKIISLKKRNKANRSMFICLTGELGAGKTVFIQAFAKKLGVDDTVNSPTFLIQKIYRVSPRSVFDYFIHIDAYRVEEKDMLALGWNDLIKRKDSVIAIEWGDKIKRVLPKDSMEIFMEHIDETTRQITFNSPD